MRTFIHDVVNPIAAIRISAGALRARGALAGSALTDLQNIEDEAEKIIRLVTALGPLPEARQATPDAAAGAPAIDLYLLCCELAALRRLNDRTEIQCRAFGDARGDWDRQQITTLLSNLLDHAVARLGRRAPITVSVIGMPRHVRVDVHGLGSLGAHRSRDVSYQVGPTPPGTTVNAIAARNGGIVFKLRIPRRSPAPSNTVSKPRKTSKHPKSSS